MKFSLLAILILSLAKPAFAADAKEEVGPGSAAELEKIYQFLCVPGSKVVEEIPADKRAQELEGREHFLSFLDNPEETVSKTAEMVIKGEGIDKFFGSIALGITCGVAEALKDKIQAGGCKGADGKDHSPAKALAACADATARIKKADPEAQE